MTTQAKDISPQDLVPHALKALEALKDLPCEQQQAALEAAAAIARSTTEYRARLYMMGTLLTRK
jgi:hypothetical protein